MKVAELIGQLERFNPGAIMSVIVHNQAEDFSITWSGNGEGASEEQAIEVNLYVDRLCAGDEKQT